MIKGRRILAVVLALVMAVSLGMVSTVYAAAPLQFEGATTVLFDQNFGGIKNAAGAPNFTIYGSNWTYASHFIMNAVDKEPYVQTKDNYDLSDASGFEFEVKMEVTSNSNTITLPGDYRVRWSNNKLDDVGKTAKALTLLKGNEVLGYKVIDLYDADTVYKVKYVDGLWTVSATTKTASASFTYEDASNPTFNGKFKVGCSYTGHYTVYYMKLTKFANTATVNHWKYEKKFSSDDSTDSLKDEGYTFSATDFTVNDNGIKSVSNNRNVTFRPYGKDFTGSYYFETAIQRSQNACWVSFNKSANGYYRLILPQANSDNNLHLIKYDAATGKTHTLVSQPFTNNTNGITATYKVKVENLTDGSIKITVNALYGSTAIPTFTYTDTATDTVAVSTTTTDSETGENVTTTTNVDTGAPLTSGVIQADWRYCGKDSYLKYINAHSIVTDADKASDKPVTYSKTYTDKTFTSADTKEALAAEGYTIDSAATIADNGIVTNNSAVMYAQDMGDNYSYDVNMYRLYNNSSIVFDKFDSNNYYTAEASYGSSTNKYIRIRKIVGGKEVSSLTQSETSSFGDQTHPSIDYGYDAVSNYNINVSTVNGTKTITFTYKSGSKGVEKTLTMVDPDPIDGAGITVTPGHTGRVVSLKAVSKYADGKYPVEVLNRTIGASDSVDTLALDGLTSSANNTYSAGGAYLYDGTITYDNVLSGNYTLETKYHNNQNQSIVYFNYVDSNNWYKYEVSLSSSAVNYIKLVKKLKGKEYELDTLSLNGSPWGWNEIRTYAATVKIDLNVDSNTGALTINVTANSGNGKTLNTTYIDSNSDTINVSGVATDTGAPITSGYYKVNSPKYTKTYFSMMKVINYPTSTMYEEDVPVYVGRFMSSEGSLMELENGAIYFEYPTALLGNYKAIATLHENNEMTGIKVISPVELYAGKVKLFTVTDAANAKVRVYFFDGEETLNRITEVYELN